MRTVAISGSASGIGLALRLHLERAGQRVVGIDRRDADVEADLGTPDGRASAVAATRRLCEGRLAGLVACAGVGPETSPAATIVSVNYFGATELLGELRDCLAAVPGSAAVAVSSNSATLVPGADGPLCGACLDEQETWARELAESVHGSQVYAASKLALARWVRRRAPGPEWAGAGIRLNAVAPGAVATPLLQAGLDDPRFGEAIRGFPIPLGGFGTPEQIAATIGFLLGPDSSFFCGSVVVVDGGTDAFARRDTY